MILMPNYNNSIPFDSNLSSDALNVNKAVEVITRQIKETGKVKRWHERYNKHLRLIILNLINNYVIDGELYTAYSRNKAVYGKAQRYNGIELRYNSMLDMIDLLWNDLGYIEGTKGYYFPGQDRTRNSRMRATDKLLKLMFDEFKVNPMDISRNPDEETIILKDKDKNLIDYQETEHTVKMRENLAIINSRISKHFIGLCVTDKWLCRINDELRAKKDEENENYRDIIDFSKTKLKRIFNNSSFEEGGRFYKGWWQSVPSRYRPYIRIDGKGTREVDFSGLHINLLYAEEGLPIPTKDVYTIEGIPVQARSMLKIALQIMLNSENEHKALWSIRDKFPREENREIFEKFTYNEIIDKFKEKHKGISKYFYTGYGVNLQFIDSQIAESVLLSLNERGIVALPIHDSFIVARHHTEELVATMQDALLRRYGQEFKLKDDLTAYELDKQVLLENIPYEDLPGSIEEYEEEWTSERCNGYLSRLERWKKGEEEV
jgi:hypothetical protein